MKTFLIFLFVISASCQTVCGQNYDKKLISTVTELDFIKTEKRGIKDKDGLVFLVQKDLQNVVAFDNGKILWKINIISVCGKSTMGKDEIRYLRLEGDSLEVVYGKHNFARVSKSSGKVLSHGSD